MIDTAQEAEAVYRFVAPARASRLMAAKAAEEVGIVPKTGAKAGKLPAC